MAKKEIKNKSKSSFNYTGKVTVTLEKKNKDISKKVLFNTGTANLFKFIAICLAGNYNSASSLRPIYLNIYSKTAPYTPNFSDKKNLTKIIANTAADISELIEDGEIVGYSTTMKFRFPLVQLNTAELNEWPDNFNLLSLFASGSEDEEPSAYLFVKDDNNQPSSIIPEAYRQEITSSADLDDYILNVQWEMQFKEEKITPEESGN